MTQSTFHPAHGTSSSFRRLNAFFIVAALAVSGALFAAQPIARPVRIAAQGTAKTAERLVPKIADSAMRQIKALETVKLAKTTAQNKIDSRLYLGLLHQRNDTRLALLTTFRFVKPEADGRVPVDILLTSPSGVKPAIVMVESLGGVINHKSLPFRRISARVHLQDLETLAAMPEIRKVRQAMPSRKQVINVSQGDRTHDAIGARAFYGVNGTGVKVGVLSDGVDSLASLQASGDLPPVVQVLPGQAGSGDEGSAMLEIVHDLAPGASLAFATADPDEATFAQNILDLAAAGCNIIVDDIIYLDESPFEDGPVAQAVNTVTASGVLYFSSAGNQGNKNDVTSGTWEGDFLANGTPPVLAGAGPVHNFGDGGQSVLVTFGAGQDTPPVLIWAEHFDLVTGNASTDFDLYDLDGGLTTIFDASTDTQDGVGGDDFPVEIIGNGTFSGERLVVAEFASGATSSVPMFNLCIFDGEFDDTVSTNGATRGHSSAADAFSVAATPAGASFDGISANGPFPGVFTAANTSEDFTSDGPRRILLGPTGVEITPGNRTSTGGIVRQKPDITAADGISAAAPTFNPFYGTSAAAPHAAAIAALLKSAVPGLTPAQVRTDLISTAIDIELPGVDRDTGAGIVMPRPALAAAGAVPMAALDAGAAVPTQVFGDGDAFVESNEIWNLTVPLTNIGGANATGINAVLTTSTPGVTINSGGSAYADLAPAASGNNATPYRFTVGPSVPCGSLIQFTLTVTFTGGPSPEAFNFSIKVGQPGAPVTISYTGPPVPIADGADLSGTAPGAVAVATLPVAGVPGNIYDINLRIDGTSCSAAIGSTTVGIDHTFVNDLRLTLRSPGGTPVLVVNNTDGSGNNFCQTVLDDEGGGASIQSVVSGNAPFTGNFVPNAPLSVLNGQAPNGNWQFEAQDFFSGDTGNIRAFSLIITPAICNAPPLTAIVSGTKTVTTAAHAGNAVTYTVTLTNTGGLAQADNPGHEFTDVLPATLTLVNATASSGTPAFNVGTRTVTWDGPLAAVNGSVTITISATINAGTAGGAIVTNQGTISYDADGNGTNEASTTTDDPGVAGTNNPTSFTVIGTAVDTVTKTVTGTFSAGNNVTYTVVITNTGNAAAGDNAGNELTDVLPPALALVTASASSGTAVATVGTNTVVWNGSVPAGGSVTITIIATIQPGFVGTTVSNQASHSYDADANGTNETTVLSNDPSTPAANDPTSFVVASPTPALSGFVLLLLTLCLALVAFKALRG